MRIESVVLAVFVASSILHRSDAYPAGADSAVSTSEPADGQARECLEEFLGRMDKVELPQRIKQAADSLRSEHPEKLDLADTLIEHPIASRLEGADFEHLLSDAWRYIMASSAAIEGTCAEEDSFHRYTRNLMQVDPIDDHLQMKLRRVHDYSSLSLHVAYSGLDRPIKP